MEAEVKSSRDEAKKAQDEVARLTAKLHDQATDQTAEDLENATAWAELEHERDTWISSCQELEGQLEESRVSKLELQNDIKRLELKVEELSDTAPPPPDPHPVPRDRRPAGSDSERRPPRTPRDSPRDNKKTGSQAGGDSVPESRDAGGKQRPERYELSPRAGSSEATRDVKTARWDDDISKWSWDNSSKGAKLTAEIRNVPMEYWPKCLVMNSLK